MILYKTKESDVVRVDGGSTKEKNLVGYSTTITGDGVKTVFAINHALNTENIILQMNDGNEQVLIDYNITDENNITITFAIPPTFDETYYITIYGDSVIENNTTTTT